MNSEIIDSLIANNKRMAEILRSLVRFSYKYGHVVVGFGGNKVIREALYEHEIIKTEVRRDKRREKEI